MKGMRAPSMVSCDVGLVVVDGEALLVMADLNHFVKLRKKASTEQLGT